MHYSALATDYDGTIAEAGVVAPGTLQALKNFREAGGTLILNTGREVGDLQSVFPGLPVFHWIVAENGALLHEVATGRETVLVEPPDETFVQRLRDESIDPLYVGRVIVATYARHEDTIAQVIDELKLPLQIILNKDALMVLPANCDKALGMRALYEGGVVQQERTVGVGDAENDFSLLQACGLGVAVANAIPELKAKAHWVMEEPSGRGVAGLVERLLTTTTEFARTV